MDILVGRKNAVNSSDNAGENLFENDPQIYEAIDKELKRQQNQIELIASENIVSNSVLEAQGSILTNKYAEGYPGKRYYGGCEFVDVAELLAQQRAKAVSYTHLTLPTKA